MAGKEKAKSDKRGSPRIAKKIQADYQMIYPGGVDSRKTFQTEDLGPGGLRFLSDQPIRPGSVLEIRLFVDAEPIELTAVAIWARESRKKGPPYQIGLQYEIISDGNFERIEQLASSEVYLQRSKPDY